MFGKGGLKSCLKGPKDLMNFKVAFKRNFFDIQGSNRVGRWGREAAERDCSCQRPCHQPNELDRSA